MSEWISVNIILPERGKRVLVWAKWPDGSYASGKIHVARLRPINSKHPNPRWIGEDTVLYPYEGQHGDRITHWMPFPEEPK